MIDAMDICRDDENIDVIVFSGEGGEAFCSGGDQGVRGHGGYVGKDEVPRLNVLDLQKQIRSIPKVVIAAVAGWSIGGSTISLSGIQISDGVGGGMDVSGPDAAAIPACDNNDADGICDVYDDDDDNDGVDLVIPDLGFPVFFFVFF